MEDFNVEQLNEMTGDDPEFKKEMVKLFFECADGCILDLENNIENNDVAWSEYAHALRGVAANFGADKISKLSLDAEKLEGSTQEERKIFLNNVYASYKKLKTHF